MLDEHAFDLHLVDELAHVKLAHMTRRTKAAIMTLNQNLKAGLLALL